MIKSPSQSYGFSSSHVWLWSWTIKKAEHHRIDAFELWCWRRLASPLNYKEIKLDPKRNQSWIFIGRTDAEVEAPILWSPDAKSWPIRKDPDGGKDWRQEEKRTTEDEIVGRDLWLDGQESEQAPRVGDGQGSLACCSPWGCKEPDTTDQLNWTETPQTSFYTVSNAGRRKSK